MVAMPTTKYAAAMALTALAIFALGTTTTWTAAAHKTTDADANTNYVLSAELDDALAAINAKLEDVTLKNSVLTAKVDEQGKEIDQLKSTNKLLLSAGGADADPANDPDPAVITALMAKMETQDARLDELSTKIESLQPYLRPRRRLNEQDGDAADALPTSSLFGEAAISGSGSGIDSFRMLLDDEESGGMSNLILFQLFCAIQEIAAKVEGVFKCIDYDSDNDTCAIGSEDVNSVEIIANTDVNITVGDESFVFDETTIEALSDIEGIATCINYDDGDKKCSLGGESIDSVDVLATDIEVSADTLDIEVEGNLKAKSTTGDVVIQASANAIVAGASAYLGTNINGAFPATSQGLKIDSGGANLLSKGGGDVVIAADSGSAYIGRNINGAFPATSQGLKIDGDGAELLSKGGGKVVVAADDSTYMGTNTAGNFVGGDNGLKIDGTGGFLNILTGDAKIIAAVGKAIAAGFASAYLGTNINGAFPDTSQGLKIDPTNGAKLVSKGGGDVVIAADSGSAYIGRNVNGAFPDDGKGLRIDSAGAKLFSKGGGDIVIAANSGSAYIGTNVAGDFGKGLKIDPTNGAKLVSKGGGNVVIAANAGSAYVGTNLEGEFPNDGNSKGLKFETSALAYTAVQLKSMKAGDRVAIAATSTYMGRDVLNPGTFPGTGDAGLKIDLFGPQLVSRGAGGDVVIASENGKAYMGTNINGEIDAADTTNGLQIDGTGSNLNIKSVGGNVEITATGDVSLTGTKITRSGASTEFDSP